MDNILIVVPAYNEGKNIGDVIRELRGALPSGDILVVNDASEDNTLDVLRDLGVDYLSLPFNLGYSASLQAGFKYAVENDYEFVVQFDGDGQHIASEVQKLWAKFRSEGADIVIGSRFKGRTSYKHPFARRVGTKIFQILTRMVCETTIYDPTSGFQILNRKIFSRYAKMHNFPQYPDANLIVEMILSGAKVCEVPVEMRSRVHGSSMHSGLIAPCRYMIHTLYSSFIVILKYLLVRSNHAVMAKVVKN